MGKWNLKCLSSCKNKIGTLVMLFFNMHFSPRLLEDPLYKFSIQINQKIFRNTFSSGSAVSAQETSQKTINPSSFQCLSSFHYIYKTHIYIIWTQALCYGILAANKYVSKIFLNAEATTVREVGSVLTWSLSLFLLLLKGKMKEREKYSERNVPSYGSLPKSTQQLGLG